jgi:hypothetical protein
MPRVIKYNVLADMEEDSNADCYHEGNSDSSNLAIYDRVEIVGS